jgi:glycosyltransferase involved in cell wall biosynthesis
MQTKANTLISVIIPVYNGAVTLRRAIASVLNQTYSNFELIIVDDGSTEDIGSVIREFKDERIVYMRQETNKGVAAGRNTGLQKAHGELIAFLDSDDEFVPEKLRTQCELFDGLDHNIGLIITNLYTSPDRDEYYLAKRKCSGYFTRRDSLANQFVPPSSWMLRKECVDRVGLFDERMVVNEDSDYFIRALEKFGIYYLNKPLGVKYNSLERKYHYSEKIFSGKEVFLIKHLDFMIKNKKDLARFYFVMAKDYAKVNMKAQAKKYYLKAFRANYSLKSLIKYLLYSLTEPMRGA